MSRIVIASITACSWIAAVAVDLGVVADPAQEPVDDARRAAAAPRDQLRGRGVDLDAEDARRPPDDRRQVVLAVEVEAVGHRRSGRAAAR